MKVWLLLALMVLAYGLKAQRISNTALYRDMSATKYLRIYYDNDFFNGTDRYYTQGVNVEYVHPGLQKFFLSKLLIHSPCKQTKYGVSIEQEAYTPTSISYSEVLRGDRPYAGSLFFKMFSVINNPVRKERFASTLSLGVLGPAAGSREIQRSIHMVVKFDEPNGWKNQIENDIILNYELEYERKLWQPENNFLFTAKAALRAGTYNTKLSAGLAAMIGKFEDPFKNFVTRNWKSQVYLYAEPLLHLVAHDATLLGGVFNNSSPYVINEGNLSRLVFQGNAGIVFKLKNTYIEYFQSYLTREFKTGRSHGWGGFRIGWYLRS
jgi:lipid A 3-O-deacylase